MVPIQTWDHVPSVYISPHSECHIWLCILVWDDLYLTFLKLSLALAPFA
jgi:hypothetical protein